MSVLVLAEHDNKEIKPSRMNTVTAAAKLGGDVVVLAYGPPAAGPSETSFLAVQAIR